MKVYHLDLKFAMPDTRYLREMLAYIRSLGFDGLMIEIDNKIIYRGYEDLAAADALSAAQWGELISFAAALGFTVYPMLQTLGHMEHILFPGSSRVGLAEIEGQRYLLCPSRAGSSRLLRDMIAQLKEVFHAADRICLGGDEARGLGTCPLCSGKSPVELLSGHMQFLARTALDEGLRPQFWADMVLCHPGALDALPQETVLIDWDYNRSSRFSQTCGWIRGVGNSLYQKPLSALEQGLPEELQPLRPYILTPDGNYNPFYGAAWLSDRGYEVVLGSAVRFHGQNLALPRTLINMANVGGTHLAASEMGCDHLVTSWAVRLAHPETTWPAAVAKAVDFDQQPPEAGLSIGGMDGRMAELLPQLQSAFSGLDLPFEPRMRFERPYADEISQSFLQMSALANRKTVSGALIARIEAADELQPHLERKLAGGEGRILSLRHWINGIKLTRLKSCFALVILDVHAGSVQARQLKELTQLYRELQDEFRLLWGDCVSETALDEEIEIKFSRDIRFMAGLTQ